MSRKRSAAIAAVIGLGATLLVAAPAAAGGSCHAAPEPIEAGTTQVDLEDNCFAPIIARVNPGDRVTWTNRDRGVAHTVIGLGYRWGTEGSALGVDRQKVSVRFDEPGIYPYACDIHPGMVGAVVVGNGRFAAAAAGIGVSDPPSGGEPPAADAAPAGADEGLDPALPLAIAAALLAIGGALWVANGRRIRRPSRTPEPEAHLG